MLDISNIKAGQGVGFRCGLYAQVKKVMFCSESNEIELIFRKHRLIESEIYFSSTGCINLDEECPFDIVEIIDRKK